MAEASSGLNSRRQKANGVRKETHDKCLDAIKEDLASWFTRLLGTAITLETFSSTLDTGVVLCQLANLIQAAVEDFVATHPDVCRADRFPRSGVTFKKRTGFPGSFIARDNVANFIRWCRELGVPDTIMFESDDVVLEKNGKQVILTLLEVARRAARFGVEPPDLIRLENEIDQEMDRDQIAADGQAQEHVILSNSKLSRKKSHSLDDLVYQVLEQCTCEPVKYQVVRISEGKYRMGEQKALIFVRIMRKNVMVRVGGGWDTLERYFDKHDPCRMQESGRRRSAARSSRCHGNDVFDRSPSSLSVGSVSSTDSQDSFNTATTTSSSSHLSGTWPAQPIKRPRDGPAKERPRNPSSSPLLGQSRPKRSGATSRGTPPRTIDTQARNRRSKSMHELSKLSVETVMGPTYAKQTSSSLRKQSVGAQAQPKAQARRQSVASTKTAPNGRGPAPGKSCCSSVTRSSSFSATSRPGSGDRTRARSVNRAPSSNGLSSSGSAASGDKTRARSVNRVPSSNGLSSSGSAASGDRTRARSVNRAPSSNGPSSSGSAASGDRTRARSVNRAPSSNGPSSSGSSVGRAAERDRRNEKDQSKEEVQRKARERSRVTERDVRSGPARRARSTPRELEASQTPAREGSRTMPRRTESQTPVPERNNNNNTQRERSKIAQRQPKDQTLQRKVSKTLGPHGKPSTNDVISQSKGRRSPNQTSAHQKEAKVSAQESSQRTKGKGKENSSSSISSILNSSGTQSSEEGVAPVSMSLACKSNGAREGELSPARHEDETVINDDEEAIRLLYETLLKDKNGSVTGDRSEVLADSFNGSFLVEESIDGVVAGGTRWNNECLRNAKVIDFSETGRSSEDLDNESRSPGENHREQAVELESGEELHCEAANLDFKSNGTTLVDSDDKQGGGRTNKVFRENGSPQIPRRRPSDLNFVSPVPRDAVVVATVPPPNRKAREVDPDVALSTRTRAMYFDVEQFSRISVDSDSASTPESPSDSPRKLSLVQSMISSIESRTKPESNVSPRDKQTPAASTAKRRQDRPAGTEPLTCAKDNARRHSMENIIADGNTDAFYPSRSADDIQRMAQEKNAHVSPANHSSAPELAVARDRPNGHECFSWKSERRKDSLEGSKERRPSSSKKTENFPRPQEQFTLEEMIEDMLPQDQGNVVFGKTIPQDLVPKHG